MVDGRTIAPFTGSGRGVTGAPPPPGHHWQVAGGTQRQVPQSTYDTGHPGTVDGLELPGFAGGLGEGDGDGDGEGDDQAPGQNVQDENGTHKQVPQSTKWIGQ
mmetsp:Transcript_62242/g.145945  ORF Transcript_62242/g.145945 Transcript_62242/m.145945 type:complete len:103 (-) Transcript_62242:907-1215(-)